MKLPKLVAAPVRRADVHSPDTRKPKYWPRPTDRVSLSRPVRKHWETNRVAPALRFIPKIIEFLGYDPWGDEQPSSLADQLKAYRRRLGLSRKKLARLLGTDESNLAGWDSGEHRPTKKSLRLISMLLHPVADGKD